MTHTPADDELCDWAAGCAPLAAAVELLIHAGLTDDADPWMLSDDRSKLRTIDFEAALAHLGECTDAEQRVLRIAASLSIGVPIDLGEAIRGLSHQHTELVMIAVAHAAGFTAMTDAMESTGEGARIVPVPPLAIWPDEL